MSFKSGLTLQRDLFPPTVGLLNVSSSTQFPSNRFTILRPQGDVFFRALILGVLRSNRLS